MGSKRCYISATEAIDKFRNGDLSPVELMQAVVDQAEKVQPTVNAFSHTFFDEAMEQAKQAELRYRDGTARPLEGIRAVSHDGQAIVGYASCLNQVPPVMAMPSSMSICLIARIPLASSQTNAPYLEEDLL